MNISNLHQAFHRVFQQVRRGSLMIALVSTSLAVTSCAMAPESPQGAAQARSKLVALQSDPNLAGRARVEFREAETAVSIAEQPLPEADAALGKHRVYVAERKVSIAEAKAATRYAEAQREQFGERRDAVRLQARTHEVGAARAETERARSAATEARSETAMARSAATEARSEMAMARSAATEARNETAMERSRAATEARNLAAAAQNEEAQRAAAARLRAKTYQARIDALQAEITDRGVVLTLGDVLFATGSAELQGSANSTLDKLVSFLNQYPERRVQIEGHTDNVGSSAYNQGLSQRRADSVRHYLTQQGIASRRLSATGLGMDQPVASNDTRMGRQQNRRVEIIIENSSQPEPEQSARAR